MNFFVNMQQNEFFGFSHSFIEADAVAIRDAKVNQRFELSNGFGTLFTDGEVTLTFGTEGRCRLYDLNYAELCRQLDEQDAT